MTIVGSSILLRISAHSAYYITKFLYKSFIKKGENNEKSNFIITIDIINRL